MREIVAYTRQDSKMKFAKTAVLRALQSYSDTFDDTAHCAHGTPRTQSAELILAREIVRMSSRPPQCTMVIRGS